MVIFFWFIMGMRCEYMFLCAPSSVYTNHCQNEGIVRVTESAAKE